MIIVKSPAFYTDSNKLFMENTSQYYSQDTSYSTDGNGHIFHGFVRAWEKNYFIIKSISTLVNKRNNKF